MTIPDSTSSPDPQFERILAELIEAAQSGAVQDPDVWAARYPEYASELRDFLAGEQELHQAMRRAAGELSPLDLEQTVLTNLTQGAEPERPRVRYFGDYELLEEIARGGMGVVFKARQVNLKRIVALKMILVGQLANDDEVRRFHAEAQAAARLEHPNIVPIFEIGQHQGQHYFSMQFIDGESLAHRVARGVLPPRDAAAIMLDVARAIAYAHVEGVVHRDLKPANILLEKIERNGPRFEATTPQTPASDFASHVPAVRPRITDFGLAMRLRDSEADQSESSRLTATGQVLGTPSYMPPEQATGRLNEVGRLSDVYSLGAVLYCLLTGRPPFQAASPLDTLLQVINEEPAAPRTLNPSVPRDLETIVLRCLEKQPLRRYAGAGELADDLRRFLVDEPIVARPIGRIERFTRMARKHRQTLTRMAATAAISLAATWGVWQGWQGYQESLNGQIEFSTSGGRMVAEVINEDGQLVVPSFPVPTGEPVTLREGAYQVRLSASGLLSDTWPLNVVQGESKSLPVQFRSRLLWPPRELPMDEFRETHIVELQEHASILQVRHPSASEYGRKVVPALRLIDGVTGKSVWPSDATLDEASVPKGRPASEWTSLLAVSGLVEDDRRLVQPLVDLDGDGVRDLMFVARTAPSLVAFSGRSGSMLWWHRARPVLPSGIHADTLRLTSSPTRSGSGVVGQAAVTDVNSDGTPDVIACFVTTGESFQAPDGVQVVADAQGWIEAISGTDGATLWRQRLESKFDSVLNTGSIAQQYNTSIKPLIVRRHEQRNGTQTRGATGTKESDRSVVLVVDRTLYSFELVTGAVRVQQLNVPASPLSEPFVADLDNDGHDELMITTAVDNSANTQWPQLTLTAITTDGKVEWSRSFSTPKSEYEWRQSNNPPLLVLDLDRDTRPEVLLPIGTFDDRRLGNRWSGFGVLDGETGDPRWQVRLAEGGYNEPPPIERFTAGPDINGDGTREVFATWFAPDQESRKHVTTVAALSGRDGARLWEWKQEAGSSYTSRDGSGPLQWWQSGQDGWPLLIVPMARGPGGQPMTFMLSASTGRLEHTLSEVFDPQVADFDGDGILDLYYEVSPQGSPRMLVAAGTQAEPWKRLGQWNPIQDLNGDHVSDLISASGDHLLSGHDQRSLFRPQEPLVDANRYRPLSPPLPNGDLNGDGTPDLIGLQEVRRRTEQGTSTRRALGAISGKDGHRLWVADQFELSNSQTSTSGERWSAEYPAFDWCDLNNDGHVEIAAATPDSRNGQTLTLSMLSGRDGSLLWQVPIVRGAFGATPNPYGRDFPDINGDGFGDLALWTPRPEAPDSYDAPSDLHVISGQDGKRLWKKSNVSNPRGGRPLWPRATVGDLDDDGQLEVVAAWHTGFAQPHDNRFRVAAVDGRGGEVKWIYEWSGTNTNILPPLIIDFEGNGQRSVCFATFGAAGHQLNVLGSDGQPRPGSPFSLSKSWRPSSRLWGKVRLTNKGEEGLLLVVDDQLCLTRGTNEAVWKWALDASPQREYVTGGAMLLDLPSERPVSDPTEEQAASVVAIWSGQGVYGLDPRTGEMRWRCRVPWSPGGAFSHGPIAELLASDDPSGAPRVYCHWRMYVGDNWHTLIRQASATTSDGRLAKTSPIPRDYVPLPPEPVPRAKLPWVTSERQALPRFIESIAIPSGLLTVLMLIVPCWLARATWRRRNAVPFETSTPGPEAEHSRPGSSAWLWTLMLAVYAAVSLKPSSFEYQNAIPSAIALITVAALMQSSLRLRSWRPAQLAFGIVLVLSVPLFLFHRWAATHPLAGGNAWGNWWWLDELLGERLLLALVGIPGVAFWWNLASAIRCGNKSTCMRLLLTATVMAIVAASVMLAIESLRLGAEQRFETTGWYTVWFWGVYLVGIGILVRNGFRLLLVWRQSRRTPRESQRG